MTYQILHLALPFLILATAISVKEPWTEGCSSSGFFTLLNEFFPADSKVCSNLYVHLIVSISLYGFCSEFGWDIG